MVGTDPARRAVHTVEGPTLHDREIGFGRGTASSDRSPTCFGRSSRTSARAAGPGRHLLRAALVAALALVAAGCGGDDAATTTDPAAVPAAVPADPGAADAVPGAVAADGTTPAASGAAGNPGATEDIPGANEITNADASAGALVKITAITPKAFAKAHCTKPILVVIYQPDAILDAKLYGEARAADKRVKGVVLLADPPREVKKLGDLPSKLGLLSAPGVAIVGRDGTIENFWTTYVDRALIERSLQNAARSKPCRVSNEEVPAAGSLIADAATVANGGTVTGTTTDPLAGAAPGTPAVDAAEVPNTTAPIA
jgi:hypothetical protein